jgi:hypothetical protein
MVAGGLLAAWIAACSGSEEQDVIATPDAAPETATDTSKPDVQADTSKPDSAPEAGPIYDAGPPTVIEAGEEYGEAGVPCVLGGSLEEEPNDDKDAANTVDPTRCGAILLTADGGTDAGVAESDFLTFQLKAATKNFYIQFSGDITLTITVDGQTVMFTPTSQPAVPFVRDKPYYIQVKSVDGKKQNWRVTIFEM